MKCMNLQTNDMVKKLEIFVIHKYGMKPTSQPLSVDTWDIVYTAKEVERSQLHTCHHAWLFDSALHSCQLPSIYRLWRQCFTPMIDLDKPNNHGWRKNDRQLDIQWVTCSPATEKVIKRIHYLQSVFMFGLMNFEDVMTVLVINLVLFS